MKRKLKAILVVVGVILVYFVANLDFPNDPLDPSTHTHYSTFAHAAVASLIALAFVALLPLGLFFIVLISRLFAGKWPNWHWISDFWRTLWQVLRE
jgi:protein-S-isoprenylcysteine O-methyltransferase Ste14